MKVLLCLVLLGALVSATPPGGALNPVTSPVGATPPAPTDSQAAQTHATTSTDATKPETAEETMARVNSAKVEGPVHVGLTTEKAPEHNNPLEQQKHDDVANALNQLPRKEDQAAEHSHHVMIEYMMAVRANPAPEAKLVAFKTALKAAKEGLIRCEGIADEQEKMKRVQNWSTLISYLSTVEYGLGNFGKASQQADSQVIAGSGTVATDDELAKLNMEIDELLNRLGGTASPAQPTTGTDATPATPTAPATPATPTTPTTHTAPATTTSSPSAPTTAESTQATQATGTTGMKFGQAAGAGAVQAGQVATGTTAQQGTQHAGTTTQAAPSGTTSTSQVPPKNTVNEPPKKVQHFRR